MEEYEIGFSMTGHVDVKAEDVVDALEDIDMYTKRTLLRTVENIKLVYIKNKSTGECTYL